MNRGATSKRSTAELTRLVEDAVAAETSLGPGLRLVLDPVDADGRPPARLRVRGTLHFTRAGSPYCCRQPGCHLALTVGAIDRIGDHVRRRMNLRQEVVVDFTDGLRAEFHEGAVLAEEPPRRRCIERG